MGTLITPTLLPPSLSIFHRLFPVIKEDHACALLDKGVDLSLVLVPLSRHLARFGSLPSLTQGSIRSNVAPSRPITITSGFFISVNVSETLKTFFYLFCIFLCIGLVSLLPRVNFNSVRHLAIRFQIWSQKSGKNLFKYLAIHISRNRHSHETEDCRCEVNNPCTINLISLLNSITTHQ